MNLTMGQLKPKIFGYKLFNRLQIYIHFQASVDNFYIFLSANQFSSSQKYQVELFNVLSSSVIILFDNDAVSIVHSKLKIVREFKSCVFPSKNKEQQWDDCDTRQAPILFKYDHQNKQLRQKKQINAALPIPSNFARYGAQKYILYKCILYILGICQAQAVRFVFYTAKKQNL